MKKQNSYAILTPKGGNNMIFKTHELPQKDKTAKSAKIIFTICGAMWAALLILITIVLTMETSNFIFPFCLVILPLLLLGCIFSVMHFDMKKAYIEICDEKITVVNYYLGIKREKVFFSKDVVCAEITAGYSSRVRGYRFSGRGFSNLKYFVFRGRNNKYLFKLICSDKTRSYIEKSFEIKSA